MPPAVTVHHGDCLAIMPTLGAVDAIVTDPPYHLGQQKSQEIGWPSWTANTRQSRSKTGFMSQQWDGGDIAFRPETWATIGAALKPGGYLLAFGGTRTWHRLACAIEDAGFVIQDSILNLIASDSRVQRFVGTLSPTQADAFSQILDAMQPSGTLAWVFGSGFPKGRTQIKPAHEPIVCAYKPGGARTLQVEECRIALNGDYKCGANGRPSQTGLGDFYDPSKANQHSYVGRWPANLLHDGSDEVLALFPQAGGGFGKRGGNGHFGKYKSGTMEVVGFGDTGSAARFFYQAKADKDDRWGSRHPTVKPVELMKWLVQLVTAPNGIVLDPFAGSGTTGVAALATGRNAILIEREEKYYNDIMERMAFYEGGGKHSTQTKNRHRAVDHGPLFGECVE